MNTVLKMPDGNTAALNEYELRQAEADAALEALEPVARQQLREEIELDAKLMIELIADAVVSLSASDETDLVSYFQRDTLAFGALIERQAEREIEDFINGEVGQKRLADIGYRLAHEERSE
jgi:hypothetical protein